jgi:hypothetical protein
MLRQCTDISKAFFHRSFERTFERPVFDPESFIRLETVVIFELESNRIRAGKICQDRELG